MRARIFQRPKTATQSGTATTTQSGAPGRKRGRKPIDKSGFSCESCHTTTSCEWRRGPNGRNTLCNRCGLRYKKDNHL